MDKIISVSKQKEFLVAKTCVGRDSLYGGLFPKPFTRIEGRQGYTMYYLAPNDQENGALVNLTNEDLVATFSMEDKGIKHGTLPLDVNFFWVKNKGANISIPLGFTIGRKTYNGIVKVEVKSMESFILQYGGMAWEQEVRDGITYLYLSEYFIDPKSEQKQKGISIELRDLFLDAIKNKEESLVLLSKAKLVPQLKSLFQELIQTVGAGIKSISLEEFPKTEEESNG